MTCFKYENKQKKRPELAHFKNNVGDWLVDEPKERYSCLGSNRDLTKLLLGIMNVSYLDKGRQQYTQKKIY